MRQIISSANILRFVMPSVWNAHRIEKFIKKFSESYGTFCWEFILMVSLVTTLVLLLVCLW